MSNNVKKWNIDTYVKTFTNRARLQPDIFKRLRDRKWHCRDCASKGISSKQYAGGGGIQGLQRGTKSRPGLIIISAQATCSDCHKVKKCDRWTGKYQSATVSVGIPKKLQERILKLYGYEDCVEQRQRQAHELVIDHKFPMERWGEAELPNPLTMTDDEIKKKFQLLKKDSSGNHNLLKSRACEYCLKYGKRAKPLGIDFYYSGTEEWPEDCPVSGSDAEQGCMGCGWYDFEAWRKALNEELGEDEENT